MKMALVTLGCDKNTVDAEHLAAACREFLKLVPEAAPFIQVGTAEPE